MKAIIQGYQGAEKMQRVIYADVGFFDPVTGRIVHHEPEVEISLVGLYTDQDIEDAVNNAIARKASELKLEGFTNTDIVRKR